MNFSTMNDEELKLYKNRLTAAYSESLGDKGLLVAILFFYGVFACIGMVMWCIEAALQHQDLWIKSLNYFLILSGAASLYYAHKKDREKIITKSLLRENLIEINEELLKRNV